jgi:hypothetical protein
LYSSKYPCCSLALTKLSAGCLLESPIFFGYQVYQYHSGCTVQYTYEYCMLLLIVQNCLLYSCFKSCSSRILGFVFHIYCTSLLLLIEKNCIVSNVVMRVRKT